MRREIQDLIDVLNGFCPTGEGGGKDNSCGTKSGAMPKPGLTSEQLRRKEVLQDVGKVVIDGVPLGKGMKISIGRKKFNDGARLGRPILPGKIAAALVKKGWRRVDRSGQVYKSGALLTDGDHDLSAYEGLGGTYLSITTRFKY